MELNKEIETIENRDDLAAFIALLKNDFIGNNSDWENSNLENFLEAMSAWTYSMENAYKNLGKDTPVTASWKTFAEILLAAKYYE